MVGSPSSSTSSSSCTFLSYLYLYLYRKGAHTDTSTTHVAKMAIKIFRYRSYSALFRHFYLFSCWSYVSVCVRPYLGGFPRLGFVIFVFLPRLFYTFCRALPAKNLFYADVCTSIFTLAWHLSRGPAGPAFAGCLRVSTASSFPLFRFHIATRKPGRPCSPCDLFLKAAQLWLKQLSVGCLC